MREVGMAEGEGVMDTIVGYMCGTDFDTELPMGQDARIYGTLAGLKRQAKCWRGCGIVKVEVKLKRVILKQDFSREAREVANP